MRVIAEIGSLFVDEVGEDIFSKLITIYPEGRPRHAFRSKLPIDDERTHDVRQLLASIGMEPWTDHSRQSIKGKEYGLRLIREYDAQDLDAAPYLELCPTGYYEALYRPESSGLVQFDGEEPRPIPDFALADFHRYVVPKRTRALIESASLIGVQFRQTVDKPSSELGQHRSSVLWYEICSSIEMPPLSDSMDLRDRLYNRPAPRDGSVTTFHAHEGLYEHAEFHYRAADMAAMPLFDLAHTKELLGGDPRWRIDKPLIASKRFYQFYVDSGLKTGWVPVRLDP